jgi:hypothetical protein
MQIRFLQLAQLYQLMIRCPIPPSPHLAKLELRGLQERVIPI